MTNARVRQVRDFGSGCKTSGVFPLPTFIMLSVLMTSCYDTWTGKRGYRPTVVTKLLSILLLATCLGFCGKSALCGAHDNFCALLYTPLLLFIHDTPHPELRVSSPSNPPHTSTDTLCYIPSAFRRRIVTGHNEWHSLRADWGWRLDSRLLAPSRLA
jgi:hypothetical protein